MEKIEGSFFWKGWGGGGGRIFQVFVGRRGRGEVVKILTGFGFQEQIRLKNSWLCFGLYLFTENVDKNLKRARYCANSVPNYSENWTLFVV